MSRSYKSVERKTTIEAAVTDGYSELQSLRDEVQEVVDNASGTNFENSQRIQTLGETADALSEVDSEPDIPESIKNIEFTYMESVKRRGGASRSVRCSNAVAILTAAKEVLEQYQEDNSKCEDDLESLINDLDGVISNAEGCEWPGMFG